VLNEALTRMDRAGVTQFATAESLQAHLEQRLRVSRNDNALVLRYRHIEAGRVRPALDALGQAYLAHQRMQARIAGGKPSLKVARSVRRRELSRNSERLETAGLIFGGLTALALVGALGLRLLLARTPTVLDEAAPSLQMLDNPQTWSPLQAQ